MEKLITPQSSIDRLNGNNKSSLDNRVKGLHLKLQEQLKDTTYELGYTYKIAKKFSDYEIYKVSDYCVRKARTPGRAFVSIFEKKLAA